MYERWATEVRGPGRRPVWKRKPLVSRRSSPRTSVGQRARRTSTGDDGQGTPARPSRGKACLRLCLPITKQQQRPTPTSSVCTFSQPLPFHTRHVPYTRPQSRVVHRPGRPIRRHKRSFERAIPYLDPHHRTRRSPCSPLGTQGDVRIHPIAAQDAP